MITEPETKSQIGEADDDDGYETMYIKELDEYVSYYDWLDDTCASLHVTNQCEAFTTFTPFDKREV